MSPRLVDRLSALRRQRVVGREAEQARFLEALSAPVAPFAVLFVHGPGGIGKTTLLGEFVRLCEERGAPAAYLDARDVDPSPEAFAAALSRALGGGPEDAPPEILARGEGRRVVLVDTFETLGPLEPWLRDHLLPQFPEGVLVVLAGRDPPSPAWRADPGWSVLLRTLRLHNLSPEESRRYLAGRRVPEASHPAALAFTHGHPLALSLVADVLEQSPEEPFLPERAPDVVKALIERFVRRVPSPRHREALEVCALLRLTTESLLAEVLQAADAHDLFEWLRGLSFVEAGPLGLFPHDLAREAISADLRWRNPERHAELHRRARSHYSGRLHRTRGAEQQRVLFDYLFLHSDNPAVRPFLEWRESGAAADEPMRPDDLPALVEMVRRHEGGDSARLAEHWLRRQPGGARVFRDGDGAPAAFFLALGLHLAGREEIEADPGARAAWAHLEARAPLRPGEEAVLVRFWMARDTYQSVSAQQSLILGSIILLCRSADALAYLFFPCAEPDFWAPMFAYADLARIPGADFEVGGRRYGVFGHDWRVVSPRAWQALLAERELARAPEAVVPPPPSAAAPPALSREAFAAAVHDALRDYTRAPRLRESPLLRSRVVSREAGPGASEAERARALMAVLQRTAESLRASPREAKYYDALHHGCFHPETSQEKAARRLYVSFSTFRRHLKAGCERVAEILWCDEAEGGGTPPGIEQGMDGD